MVAVLVLLGAGLAPARAAAPPPVRHVWVIELENEAAASALADHGFLGHPLQSLGEVLTSAYATGHESLDNYVSQISGQAPNPVTQNDCQDYVDVAPGTVVGGQAVGAGCVYPKAVQTLADQLSSRGLTWKGYMGDMGNDPARDHTDANGACGHPVPGTADGTQKATATDQYATRHDPFVYFHTIVDSPAACANVVALTRFAHDLAAPANFSWITPNLCDDGHDATCVGTNLSGTHAGGFVAIDDFLSRYVPMITGSAAFKRDGLLIVTFDESALSDTAACCGETPGPSSPLPGIGGPGGGHVATVVVSPFVRPGSTDATAYNHYSMLRTLEDLFGVGHLGEAAAAPAWGPDVFNAVPVGSPGSGPGPVGSPGSGRAVGPGPGPGLAATGGRSEEGPAAVGLVAGLALLVVLRRSRRAGAGAPAATSGRGPAPPP